MASSPADLPSLPCKRSRHDFSETDSQSPSSEADDVCFKRLHSTFCCTPSLSSQSSCVSACDAFFPEENPVGCRVEGMATFEPLVAVQSAAESVEEADSSNGNSLVSHEGESKDSTSAEECGLDHAFTASTFRDQKLRRTVSEAAESSSGEDAQVDIDCFLKDWEDDVDGVGFNPADVFKNELHPDSEESFDAAFTPDSDALGVSVAAIDNETWFFSDLGCDGQIYWNEAQDQEWMTTAVANLDRINDAFASDASMLQLLEAGPGI